MVGGSKPSALFKLLFVCHAAKHDPNSLDLVQMVQPTLKKAVLRRYPETYILQVLHWPICRCRSLKLLFEWNWAQIKQ